MRRVLVTALCLMAFLVPSSHSKEVNGGANFQSQWKAAGYECGIFEPTRWQGSLWKRDYLFANYFDRDRKSPFGTTHHYLDTKAFCLVGDSYSDKNLSLFGGLSSICTTPTELDSDVMPKLPLEIGRIEGPQGFSRDEWLEHLMLYKDRNSVLQNIKNEPYPLGSFEVRIARNGTGHLQSHCAMSAFFERPEPEYKNQSPKQSHDGVFLDWKARTSFLKKNVGWTKLDFEEAKALWGKPREHFAFIGTFYTFDAHSFHGDEENIYHLDLHFEDGELEAYRVRGIGITNPVWITKGTAIQ